MNADSIAPSTPLSEEEIRDIITKLQTYEAQGFASLKGRLRFHRQLDGSLDWVELVQEETKNASD